MAIYQRHELTKIVLDYYRGLGIDLIIAGSEGVISQEVAKGFKYIEVPNSPLTYKNNAMLKAVQKYEHDAVVLLGSDDLICPQTVEFYKHLQTDKVFGFSDIYFYSTEHRQLGYLELDKHFGAGRFFPKSVLEKCNYKAWQRQLDRGCDTETERYFKTLGIEFERISIKKNNLFLIDIKHDYNISSKNIIFACKKENFNIMAKKVGKQTANKVEQLTFTPKSVLNGYVRVICNDKNESLKGRTLLLPEEKANLIVAKGWGVYEG